MEIDDSTRHELALLARRPKARFTEFSPMRPTDWRPWQVRNPRGYLDTYFTDEAAWELIATKLESRYPVEVVLLQKPPGRKGYVMKIDLGDGERRLYVKLQLGSGTIIGRSFHYSEYPLVHSED